MKEEIKIKEISVFTFLRWLVQVELTFPKAEITVENGKCFLTIN